MRYSAYYQSSQETGVNFDNSFLDTKPLALSIKDANHNMKRSNSGQLKQTEQEKTWE